MKKFEKKRSLSASKNFNKPAKNITSLINIPQTCEWPELDD